MAKMEVKMKRRQYGRDGTERKMRRVQVEVRKIESWKKYGEDWKVEYGKGDFSKGKDEKKNKREVRETEEGREKSKKKNLKEQRTRQGTRGLKLVKGEKKKAREYRKEREEMSEQSRYIRLEERGEKRADCREKRGGT